MLLNKQSFGEESGTPLLIVHGLFGAGRNWRALARNFAKSRWVVTVDMRNHGESFRNDSNTYEDMAGDLATCIADLGGTADVLGHSMGGKAAMVLALSEPAKVSSLIVADIAPVSYAHDQTDNIRIMQNLPLHEIARRSQAQKMLGERTNDPALAAFFAQSISFDGDAPAWLLNLSALADNMDAIIGFPEMGGMFNGETLVVRGGESDYVDSHGTAQFIRLFPNHRLETIEGAGHWLHAEKPHQFIEICDSFLSR